VHPHEFTTWKQKAKTRRLTGYRAVAATQGSTHERTYRNPPTDCRLSHLCHRPDDQILASTFACTEPASSLCRVSDDVLHDLLKQCRLELSGVFSREDLFILLNGVFQSRYAPNELHRLATSSVMTWVLKLTKPNSPACGRCWNDYFH